MDMMILKMKTKIAFLFLGFGLFACEPADKYGDELLTRCKVGVPMITQVILVENEAAVEKIYVEHMKMRGKPLPSGTRSGFCILRSNNMSTCFLPVLRGQRDKERLYLWGHEFAHVICGPWHDSDYRL